MGRSQNGKSASHLVDVEGRRVATEDRVRRSRFVQFTEDGFLHGHVLKYALNHLSHETYIYIK